MNHRLRLIALNLLLFIFILGNTVSAQGYSNSDYKNNPLWIKMMQDTSVNFNETVKAFRLFFLRRALPHEPGEIEGTDKFEIAVGLENEEEGASLEEKLKERKKEKKRQLEYAAKSIRLKEPTYNLEVKAFRNWYYQIQPWLRDKGIIIGPKERQLIIDRQKMELKQIEANNR